METFLDSILAERICRIIQEKQERDKTIQDQRKAAMEQWGKVLEKQGKEVEKAFDRYFCVSETWEAEVQEELYLAGFSDAVRLLKRIQVI